MFLSKKLLPAALCVGVSVIAMSAGAQGMKKKKITYERSAFSVYQSLPANKAAKTKVTGDVKTQFPGWVVSTDKLSGAFTDIYGSPIALSGATNAAKARSCISDRLNALGINAADWMQVSDLSAPKADYINYTQQVNGHPVAFARMSFRFTKGGMLARIQARNYGNPNTALQPTISTDAAITAALQGLDGATITSAKTDANWAWFPVPTATGYALHPAWTFKIIGKVTGSVPLILTGYVDGLTGELLYRTNQVKEIGYDLTVKGVVYKNGTLNPTSTEALTDLGLVIGSDTYFTDTAGLATSAGLVLPLPTTVPLAGRWSTVYDSVTGLMPSFTDTVALGGTTYIYPTTAPASERHINAYYHVNRVHNFMKSFFPSFTGMDFSLPTNVDMVGSCNAFYSGTDINFYAEDATCYSFANLGDVVYHEYGHGITDHFYTMVTGATINNGALNEATSDIWALSITHKPILAENAFTGYGGFIRRYDMTPQVYPIDLETDLSFADPHKNGQIIAGTWWDLGTNLGSVDSMTKLFTDVYYDAPDGPDGTEGAVYQSMLIDVLMADDDNSNLLDGTPHYSAIVAAFAKHGIYLEQDAVLTHTELGVQAAGQPIPVLAYLTDGSDAYYHDITLNYRINSTGAWTAVVMNDTLPAHTATIPAQVAGTTVEYYFTVHDALHIANAFFPITCNPALPANQVSLPFQFAVGVQAIDSNNFEGPVAGWGIGSNPGDDATDGLWQQAVPVPFVFFTVWPNGDHTTGTGQCLITGNGSTENTVTSGTTTVLTPIFDISSFTTPVISYYRWFSNEQGYENFKNDPWIVKVRSTGAWQTVENTYQCDDNWRHRIFPVSAFLPGTPTQVQLQFFASDSVLSNWADGGASAAVGGVDDFTIYDKSRPNGVQSVARQMVQVYPNPADDQLQITLQVSEKGMLKLYDVNGKSVRELTTAPGTDNYTMDTRSLAEGSYSLVIQTGSYIQSKKVVVAHN